MCRKHYVAVIKLIIALSLAQAVYGMEVAKSTPSILEKRIIYALAKDEVEELETVLKDNPEMLEAELQSIGKGLTPLLFAAMKNSVKSGEYLLNLGANPRPQLKLIDPCIMIAAMNNSVAFLEMLRAKKFDLEETNQKGHTSLYAAIFRNADESVDFLLQAGVDRKSVQVPDLPYTFPLLHFAAFTGSDKAAQVLIEKYNYSVNESIYVGALKSTGKLVYVTPNDMAVMGGHWKVCELLKSKGANSLSHHGLMTFAFFNKSL